MIFLGSDNKRPVGDRSLNELVNRDYWDAFGDLLDEALLDDYPYIHQIIKSEEGYALNYYFFDELSKSDFNKVVRVIRAYLAKMTLTDWDWQHRDYVQELLTWQAKGFLAWVKPEDWGHRSRMQDIAAWQAKARSVWEKVAEPFIMLDGRYDANLAGDPHS